VTFHALLEDGRVRLYLVHNPGDLADRSVELRESRSAPLSVGPTRYARKRPLPINRYAVGLLNSEPLSELRDGQELRGYICILHKPILSQRCAPISGAPTFPSTLGGCRRARLFRWYGWRHDGAASEPEPVAVRCTRCPFVGEGDLEEAREAFAAHECEPTDARTSEPRAPAGFFPT